MTAEVGPLFNHLICPPEHRRRDRQANGLRGLQVHCQIELRRLFDWKVSGLGPFENAVHEVPGPSELIRVTRPVAHEQAGLRIFLRQAQGRQAVLDRQFGDPDTVRKAEGARADEESAGSAAGRPITGTLKVPLASHLYDLKLEPQCRRRGFHLTQRSLGTRVPRILQNGHAGEGRDRLLEELETLANHVCTLDGYPCNVASWPREARHEAVSNRVTGDHHDNWNRRRCLLRGRDGVVTGSDDDIDPETHQLGDDTRVPLRPPVYRADFERDILAFDIA